MRPVPSLPAALTRRPFTAAQARALGVSRSVLRHAALRRPYPGVFVPAQLPETWQVRAQAALLALPPGSAITGSTAVELCRLPQRLGRPPAATDPVDVAVPSAAARPELPGIAPCQRELAGRVLTLGDGGIRVVHPRHLWIELAQAWHHLDALALADAVCHRWSDRASMAAALGEWAGHRGVVAARRVLTDVRSGVESPMETRARVLVIKAGLPEPACGRDIVVDGEWLARGDLVWAAARVVVEFDGDQHRTDRRQWMHDVRRRRLLEAAGWRVISFTADDVLRRPQELVALVASALRERGLRW